MLPQSSIFDEFNKDNLFLNDGNNKQQDQPGSDNLASISSNTSSSQQLGYDDNVKGIVYVHVGKTGGEWIKAQMKMVCKTRRNRNIRAVCLQQKYPTQLSKLTVGYIHASNIYFQANSQKQTLPRTNSIQEVSNVFSHYLFSIRHPLRRLVSWYTYNHPKSCDEREPHSPSCKTSQWKTLFYGCFPTLQELANHNIAASKKDDLDGDDDDECTKTFWNGWHGKGDNMEPKDSNHLHWNYQFYWNETMVQTPDKKFLVIRLELIEKDLISLEGYLRHETVSKKIYWHPPDSFHFTRGGAPSQLDKTGTQRLCCLLLEETTIYRQILHQTINPLEKKDQSMQQIHEICKFSSWDEYNSECSNR